MAACKTCGAEIRWVRMRSGRAMPVDQRSVPVVLVNDDGGEEVGDTRLAYVSHFATCPQAGAWRRKEGSR